MDDGSYSFLVSGLVLQGLNLGFIFSGSLEEKILVYADFFHIVFIQNISLVIISMSHTCSIYMYTIRNEKKCSYITAN